MKTIYYIDDTDEAFPRIDVRNEPDDYEVNDYQEYESESFTRVKQTLIKVLRYKRDHWLDQIKYLKGLKKGDVT